MKNRIFKYSFLLVVAVGLVACGGGGSSTQTQNPAAAAGVSSTPYTPFALTSALVTSVPASTYLAGSEEEIAFNLLNAERQNCGFGLLTQNPQLDQSSKAHADWLLVNNYTLHWEVAGTTGFTGVAPADRIFAAGYTAGVGTEAEYDDSFSNNKAGLAQKAIHTFLNAPYHAFTLLSGYKDVGIAMRSSLDTSTPQNRVVANLNFGYKTATGQQSGSMSNVATYPCQGSANVEYQLKTESPNPVPGRNLGTNPLGSTIVVILNPNQIAKITNATVTNTATGAPVTMRAPVDYSNDPNGMLAANEAYVSADAPMAPNTTYQVVLNGTNGTTPFSRTFTFTTKP